MVVFDVNSVWSRGIRRAAVVAVTSVSLLASESQQAFAEKPSRAKVPKIAEATEPRSNNSFDEAIRKLLKEAKSAESKGEIDRAVFLAERAAKISESSSELVKTSKDVSPAVTAGYARVLRQKRSELIAKQKAAEASSDIEIAKSAPAKKSAPAASVVSAPQAPEVAQRKAPAPAEPPAVASRSRVENAAHQEANPAVSTTDELPPSPKVTPRDQPSVAHRSSSKWSHSATRPEAVLKRVTPEVGDDSSKIVQSSGKMAGSGISAVAPEKSIIKEEAPVRPKVDEVLQAGTDARDSGASWDSPAEDAVESAMASKADEREASAALGSNAEAHEKFEDVARVQVPSVAEVPFSLSEETIESEKTQSKSVAPFELPFKSKSGASQTASTRDTSKIKDIREAIRPGNEASDSEPFAETQQETVAVETAPSATPPSTPSVKLRKRQAVDVRSLVVESESHESLNVQKPADSKLAVDDSVKSGPNDWSLDDAPTESSDAKPDLRGAVVQNEKEPVPTSPVVEPEIAKPHRSVAVKVRPAFHESKSAAAVEVESSEVASQQKHKESADNSETIANREPMAKEAQVAPATESIAKGQPPVVQPFRLRKSYRDRQTGELESFTPEVQPSESDVAHKDTPDSKESVAVSGQPRREIGSTAVEGAVVSQATGSGTIKVRSSFQDPLPKSRVSPSASEATSPETAATEETLVAHEPSSSNASVEASTETPSVAEPFALTPFRLRSKTGRRQSVVQEKSDASPSQSQDWSEQDDQPVVTIDVPQSTSGSSHEDASVTSPPVNLSPFKLRSRQAEPQVAKVGQEATPKSGSSSGTPDDSSTVATSEVNVEAGTTTATKGATARSAGPLKLRSSFRDSQIKTSVASDAENGAPNDVDNQKPIVIVKHEATAEANDAPEVSTPSVETPAATQRPTGTLKLRPAFRDTQSKPTSGPGTAATKPESTAPATAKPQSVSGGEGRSTIVQWRSSKSEAAPVADELTREELSSSGTSSRSRLKAGNNRLTQPSDLVVEPKEEAVHLTAHNQVNRLTSEAKIDLSDSADTSRGSVRRELRASLWDSAPAPAAEAPTPTRATADSSQTAPLPPKTDGGSDGMARRSTGQKSAKVASSREGDAASSLASLESSVAEVSAPLSEDSNHSLKSKRKERPVAHEDDHAASTRAILASGPIQRLAKLTGIPMSSASALVGSFGMIMLIGGLWMIRATLGFRQAQ